MLLADDLNQLLDILPQFISTPLKKHPKQEQLIEIVLDIGNDQKLVLQIIILVIFLPNDCLARFRLYFKTFRKI